MKTAEEILDEHCIELREEFLTTAKSRKFKQKVLAAMEDYKNLEIEEDEDNVCLSCKAVVEPILCPDCAKEYEF